MRPDSRSHTFSVLSSDAETARRPSGVTATPLTESEWPSRVPSARKLHPKAVQFDWGVPADGRRVAFTGFPLEARDPMTFRAHVAAYRGPRPNLLTPELVLDHASQPGFSGAPVFLADGTVVAILVRDGKPRAEGMSIARPISAVREMLIKTSEK